MTSEASNNSESCFHLQSPCFCNVCGTILPLPTSHKFIKCPRCNNRVDIEVFHNYEVKRTILFNKIVETGENEIYEASTGPSIDRICSNCGNPTMTYKTQQTRSADEGQTVFYNCPKCDNQEIEYS